MKPHITITLIDIPGGGVSVRTNDEPPALGRVLSPAQSLSMDLLRTCKAQANDVRFAPDASPVVAFARRCLDPEGFGFAVTPEVRRAAREALGLPALDVAGEHGRAGQAQASTA